MGYPWKRESLILRLLFVFIFQFFCFNGVPLEKGVLDFEIAFCFFSSILFCFNGVPLEKGILDFEIAHCFFSVSF